MQLYKKIEKLMKMDKYKQEIAWLRAHRSTNADLLNEKIRLKKKDLPIYQEINRILRTAQEQAEAMLASERPDIRDTIETQKQVNNSMKQGDVPRATRLQKEHQERQKLLTMPK